MIRKNRGEGAKGGVEGNGFLGSGGQGGQRVRDTVTKENKLGASLCPFSGKSMDRIWPSLPKMTAVLINAMLAAV